MRSQVTIVCLSSRTKSSHLLLLQVQNTGFHRFDDNEAEDFDVLLLPQTMDAVERLALNYEDAREH